MLLNASNLAFAYDKLPVLADVSIALAAGEVVALLGPNGSGKSTLIRCLLGQLRGAGDIHWDGRPTRRWRPRELARFVSYLPQSPTWEPTQSVYDAIALGRSPFWGAFGVESPRDADVIASVLRELGLADLGDRPLGELSGGQRQRVLLARCLAQEPRAMLLDEPNTFLDLKHQVELAGRLRKLAAERGIGVLMASHDLNLAGMFADRLVLLSEGRVVADGSVSDVLDPVRLERVYGVPMERIVRDDGTLLVAPRML